MWLPRWPCGKESVCQCRRLEKLGFDSLVRKVPWSRKWQPTPVFLPGKFHGERSLAGYICSSWVPKELNMSAEHTHSPKNIVCTLKNIYIYLILINLKNIYLAVRGLSCGM